MEYKDKILKIIEHYGILPQLKYFQSEVFELNEAIINYEKDYNSMEIQDMGQDKEHITEEIADVLVMLHQFAEYYKIQNSDIYMVMEQKIDRQIERIEDEK